MKAKPFPLIFSIPVGNYLSTHQSRWFHFQVINWLYSSVNYSLLRIHEKRFFWYNLGCRRLCDMSTHFHHIFHIWFKFSRLIKKNLRTLWSVLTYDMVESQSQNGNNFSKVDDISAVEAANLSWFHRGSTVDCSVSEIHQVSHSIGVAWCVQRISLRPNQIGRDGKRGSVNRCNISIKSMKK